MTGRTPKSQDKAWLPVLSKPNNLLLSIKDFKILEFPVLKPGVSASLGDFSNFLTQSRQDARCGYLGDPIFTFHN